MLRNFHCSKGFTLIELLLLIAIIAIIAGLSMPFYSNYVVRGHLKNTSASLVSSIEKAQSYTKSGRLNDQWGVYISGSTFTLYKGSSFTARDTNFDESYDIPGSLIPSGLSEITFDHLRGETSNTGSITITATNGDTITIQVDSSGIQSVE